jgi:hypothetical protein
MRTTTAYNDPNVGDIVRVINNTSQDNINWGLEQVNDATRYLVEKYFLNERSYTTLTVSGQQFYNLPPQVENLINVTVLIGNVLWQPKPCSSRQLWDNLNVIQFTQDFPSYFFVYNGQMGLYPTPSSAGNKITMNYKTRIVDLQMPDVVNTGTVTVTTGTANVVSTQSVFTNWMQNQWMRVPFTNNNATSGDNQWYQIQSITNGTTAVLYAPYTGPTASSGTYTIGQVSILPEDYQDLPLYRMGVLYYTTRFPDPVRAQVYQKMWDDGVAKLDEQFGAKTSNVVLSDTDITIQNPNLFATNLTQTNI